mgnify:CR=1 FL=1|jgi:hypothetical protein
MTAAERFKQKRLAKKASNKSYSPDSGRLGQNVNKMTEKEYKNHQSRQNKHYDKYSTRAGVLGFIGKPISNAVNKTRRLFAPSDNEVLQKRMEKAVGKKYLKKRK